MIGRYKRYIKWHKDKSWVERERNRDWHQHIRRVSISDMRVLHKVASLLNAAYILDSIQLKERTHGLIYYIHAILDDHQERLYELKDRAYEYLYTREEYDD